MDLLNWFLLTMKAGLLPASEDLELFTSRQLWYSWAPTLNHLPTPEKKTHHRSDWAIARYLGWSHFFMASIESGCLLTHISLLQTSREVNEPEFLPAIEIQAINNCKYTFLAAVRVVSLIFELPNQNTINKSFSEPEAPPYSSWQSLHVAQPCFLLRVNNDVAINAFLL